MEQAGKVFKHLGVALAQRQALEQDVAGIDFEYRLGFRKFLTAGAQYALHLNAHLLFSQRQAGGRIGQPGRGAHVGDCLAQHAPDTCQQCRNILRVGALCRLDRSSARQFIGDQGPAGYVPQFMPFELAQVTHHPLVDRVREQEHFQTALSEHFQLRTGPRRYGACGGDVIDFLLVGGLAFHVFRQGRLLFVVIRGGCGETQQAQYPLTVADVLHHAFLEYGPELVPEFLVILRVFLDQPVQHVQHPARQGLAHCTHVVVLLQQLAGYVQRQVTGVHHAPHKPQVQGQKLLRVVHDEDPPHV